jgi:hypothetical protein
LYLNEYCWRYNRKDLNEDELLDELVKLIVSNHVTYKDIREYNPFKGFEVKPKRIERIDDFKMYGSLFKSITVNGQVFSSN